MKIYYNSDTDQIYVTYGVLRPWVMWTKEGTTYESTLFCGDDNYWHYIGEL